MRNIQTITDKQLLALINQRTKEINDAKLGKIQSTLSKNQLTILQNEWSRRISVAQAA
jgi:hypothetical protein